MPADPDVAIRTERSRDAGDLVDVRMLRAALLELRDKAPRQAGSRRHVLLPQPEMNAYRA
jgi:hypothetical protein